MRFAGMALIALAIAALACQSTGESSETAAHPQDMAVATGENQDIGKQAPDAAAEELQEQYEQRRCRNAEDPEQAQDAEEPPRRAEVAADPRPLGRRDPRSHIVRPSPCPRLRGDAYDELEARDASRCRRPGEGSS